MDAVEVCITKVIGLRRNIEMLTRDKEEKVKSIAQLETMIARLQGELETSLKEKCDLLKGSAAEAAPEVAPEAAPEAEPEVEDDLEDNIAQ